MWLHGVLLYVLNPFLTRSGIFQEPSLVAGQEWYLSFHLILRKKAYFPKLSNFSLKPLLFEETARNNTSTVTVIQLQTCGSFAWLSWGFSQIGDFALYYTDIMSSN